MTPPRVKRFDSGDVKDAGRLADQLNRMVVDLTPSPDWVYRELVVRTVSPLDNTFPIVMAHGLPNPPRGLEIVQARNLTDSNPFLFGIFVTWEPDASGRNIIIRYIAGIDADYTYSFRFRVGT